MSTVCTASPCVGGCATLAPSPITRFLMRISVDRYPGEPERSNQLYRAHPLTWDELGLTARCGGEEMA